MSRIEVSDAVRAAAQRAAPLDRAEMAQLLSAGGDPAVEQLAELLAEFSSQLIRDLASGQTPAYSCDPNQGLSPAQAAKVLGYPANSRRG
jgi:hypothetical protein